MSEDKDTTKNEAPAEEKAEEVVKTEPEKAENKKKAAKESSKEEKSGTTEEAPAKKKKKSKKRLVLEGKVYIQASFNNTIVTVTDTDGNVLSWSSAGANGFKGPKKATPFAAQTAAESAVTKAKVYGVERAHVFIKGAGNGREQAIRGIQAGGINVEGITDLTAVPHNGTRPKKSRRV